MKQGLLTITLEFFAGAGEVQARILSGEVAGNEGSNLPLSGAFPQAFCDPGVVDEHVHAKGGGLQLRDGRDASLQ